MNEPFKVWKRGDGKRFGVLLKWEGMPVALLCVDTVTLGAQCERRGDSVTGELNTLLKAPGEWIALPGLSLDGRYDCRLVRWPERLPKSGRYPLRYDWLGFGGFGYFFPLPGFERATAKPDWLSAERLDALRSIRPAPWLVEEVRAIRLREERGDSGSERLGEGNR